MRSKTENTVTDNIPMFSISKEMFLETLKNKQLSGETIRGYSVDLNQFQKFLIKDNNAPVFMESITTEAIEAYVKMLRKRKLTPTSINRKINSISYFCKFAIKKCWLSFNPADDVDRIRATRKERTFLKLEEIQAIVAKIPQVTIKYVVILMSNTGLRINEAINLRLQDVDFENKILHVIQGKGGKNRDVPLNDELIKHLTFYKDRHRSRTKSLNFFVTKSGGISQQYVNQELKKAAKAAGIEKDVTSHVLRHSFASQLVQTDTHVAIISKLLGHADVRTTSIYMHADQEDLQQAVNTIKFLN
ncbi:tyrosine-type recombinase/integrase [Lysinibacillus sp. G4S2]|uniref:tyrosine-type recombinase/integrase n=1 Tax=Lysinibacillus sp. G4S2 TaxID=3055859 RepID=UPI0025A2D622|nr:tyrosine-type recombinase/integrase [Lysinibacillus sp. G4S2]MDM5246436.1 tyrosine-type recombinase/integrase [Lysinibacillus sp. G4S2]